MLYRKVIAVCSLIRTEHINKLCEQNIEFVNVWYISWPLGFIGLYICYKTSQLTLYREIIAVCSQIHTKHINTVCGQNVEFVNVRHSKHLALDCLTTVLTPAT